MDTPSGGAESAVDPLFEVVYDDLKRVARAQLRRLRPGQTLDTTSLVHEAYFKFSSSSVASRPAWQSRAHFYAVAARAMRQILVDYARRAGRLKRGAGAPRLELDEQRVAGPADLEQLVEIDQALGKLAAHSERLAQVVEYRVFAALTNEEIAELLGVTERTVRNDWARAKAWLGEAMRG
jgi:RNA polymerase sigma factor (TIGR02999 family)